MNRPLRPVALLLVLSVGHAQSPSPEAELPAPLRSAAGLVPAGAKFSFVRAHYTDRMDYRSIGSAGLQPAGAWSTDYPDADRHFSRFVAELTGLPVAEEGVVVSLGDPALLHHPFVYLVEGGKMQLTDEESEGLRNYLNGGGFLLVDKPAYRGISALAAIAMGINAVVHALGH